MTEQQLAIVSANKDAFRAIEAIERIREANPQVIDREEIENIRAILRKWSDVLWAEYNKIPRE